MRFLFLLCLIYSNIWAQVPVQKATPFSKLWVVVEFNWLEMNWRDLGLERETSFTQPLSEAWKKWLEDNLAPTVSGVEICHDECLSYFESWQSHPQERLSEIHRDEYADGLWLKLTINVRKKTSASDELKLEWDGHAVILDIANKRHLGQNSSGSSERVWRELDQTTLNSQLASLIYRLPLNGLSELQKILARSRRLNRISSLIIKGYHHLGEVSDIIKEVKTRGQKLGIEVGLKNFTKNEATLIIFYQGEEKEFSDLLSQLKELKSSKSYRIESGITGQVHVMTLHLE